MSPKARRRLFISLGACAGLVVLVVAGTFLYVRVFSGDPPAPLALATPGSTRDPGASGETIDLNGTWTVGAGSAAGYRVDEVLNGQDNTVVGRTSNVDGDVTVTNKTATAGTVTVDMTTVTTDSGARDGQFQGSIMRTDQFPTSTFALTEPVSLTALRGGGPISVTTTGELTIRDVTKQVDVKLDMQLSEGNVEVAGSIPVTFADFDIDPPNLGFVRVEDHGLVEFLLTLHRG
jgi:polyisoprenoid-binding protein YceI